MTAARPAMVARHRYGNGSARQSTGGGWLPLYRYRGKQCSIGPFPTEAKAKKVSRECRVLAKRGVDPKTTNLNPNPNKPEPAAGEPIKLRLGDHFLGEITIATPGGGELRGVVVSHEWWARMQAAGR